MAAKTGRFGCLILITVTNRFPEAPEVQVILDAPVSHNRIVPEKLFNRETLELYSLGPEEGREAVLLTNKNTVLTTEKTIEYFI